MGDQLGVSQGKVLVEHGDVRAHGDAGGRRDLQAPLTTAPC